MEIKKEYIWKLPVFQCGIKVVKIKVASLVFG
jgi:hypothetical protein